MVTDWIFDENLRPFLTALGWIVGYQFDNDDWEAISLGVRDSDGETGRWYEYEFHGQHSSKLVLARDPGTSVLQVRASVPAELEPQIRLAVFIFQRYHARDLTA
jgi:hypothetical protein